MPWNVIANDEGCPVSSPWGVRKTTGRLLSCHESKREALSHLAALHAGENLEGRLSGLALAPQTQYGECHRSLLAMRLIKRLKDSVGARMASRLPAG